MKKTLTLAVAGALALALPTASFAQAGGPNTRGTTGMGGMPGQGASSLAPGHSTSGTAREAAPGQIQQNTGVPASTNAPGQQINNTPTGGTARTTGAPGTR